MPAGTGSFRAEALGLLVGALGEPQRAGDCYQWARTARDGTLTFRLTIYHDGPEALVDGWLFIPADLERPQRLSLRNRGELERLVERCGGLRGRAQGTA
jgi:hypothetical protein